MRFAYLGNWDESIMLIAGGRPASRGALTTRPVSFYWLRGRTLDQPFSDVAEAGARKPP